MGDRGAAFVVWLVLALVACGDDDAPSMAPDGGEPIDGAMVADGGRRDAAGDVDSGPEADAGSVRTVLDPLVDGSHEVLFVGNSYVFTHDVSGRYRAIADALPPEPVRVEAVAFGGWRFVQHAEDATTDGAPLSTFLRTGTEAERAFDAVIFQEQSQIGGFEETHPERIESMASIAALAELASANGSAIVLYQTWGRRDGDPTISIYESFDAMEDNLERGYRAMAAMLREAGHVVRVAPVGGAFRLVFEDVIAAGGNPTDEGSDFFALYEPDGSHPSPRGAYLAACVIEATVTGADPQDFPDGDGLDGATSMALRDVAHRVITSDEWAPELADVRE